MKKIEVKNTEVKAELNTTEKLSETRIIGLVEKVEELKKFPIAESLKEETTTIYNDNSPLFKFTETSFKKLAELEKRNSFIIASSYECKKQKVVGEISEIKKKFNKEYSLLKKSIKFQKAGITEQINMRDNLLNEKFKDYKELLNVCTNRGFDNLYAEFIIIGYEVVYSKTYRYNKECEKIDNSEKFVYELFKVTYNNEGIEFSREKLAYSVPRIDKKDTEKQENVCRYSDLFEMYEYTQKKEGKELDLAKFNNILHSLEKDSRELRKNNDISIYINGSVVNRKKEMIKKIYEENHVLKYLNRNI